MRQFPVWAASLGLALLFTSTQGHAQETAQSGRGPGSGRGQAGGGQFANMQRVTGVVTAVAGDNLTVKTEDGTVQVVTTANTRIMKGQGEPLKIADLKAGDGVMAMGNLDAPNKTLHAAMMFATDAEQVKKLRENLGKTYIAGKVTAIDADNLKMTVMRQDGVAQTIGFDDSTSFKRGGRGRIQMGAGGGAPTGSTEGAESITLADIKIGDNIAGQGSVKGGVFVPTQLNVLTPRAPRAPRTSGGEPAPAAPPQ